MSDFINDYPFLFILIVLAVLALIGFFVCYILYKLKRKNALKRIDECKKTINSPNLNYFKTNLSRVETIAIYNSDYKEVHSSLLKTYNNLFDKELSALNEECKKVFELAITEKTNKKILEQIENLEIKTADFNNKVAVFSNDLEEIFQASNTLREKKIKIVDLFQEINNDFNQYSNSLSLVYTPLEEYLFVIKEKFGQFDELIKCGRYEKAAVLVDSIEKLVNNVFGKIPTIATYNNLVTTTIPEELSKLNSYYLDNKETTYLEHLNISGKIESINDALLNVKNDFSKLDFSSFDEINEKIMEIINDSYIKINEELEANHLVSSLYDEIKDKFKYCDTYYLDIKRQYKMFTSYYVVSHESSTRFDTFEDNYSRLITKKREYDSLSLTSSINPSSLLFSYLKEIKEITLLLEDDINFFPHYFNQVKCDIESLFTSLNEIGANLMIALGSLKEACLFDEYYRYYNESLPYFEILNELSKTMNMLPIDYQVIESRFNDLKLNLLETITNINKDHDNLLLINKLMIYANPLRYSFNKANEMLDDVSVLMERKEYEKALEQLKEVLVNYDQDAYSKIN